MTCLSAKFLRSHQREHNKMMIYSDISSFIYLIIYLALADVIDAEQGM